MEIPPDTLKFTFGDMVYHVADKDQSPGIVTGINHRPGMYVFIVDFPNRGGECHHYDFELTKDRQYVDSQSTE